ncbi:MAG: hypothetical protein ACYC10_16050 [Allorhizobium sp.]
MKLHFSGALWPIGESPEVDCIAQLKCTPSGLLFIAELSNLFAVIEIRIPDLVSLPVMSFCSDLSGADE